MSAFAPILVIQVLKVCDLGAETPNFFTKDCEMIHNSRIAHSERSSVGANPVRKVGASEAKFVPLVRGSE
jgi:hypothetical protein